MRECLLPAPQSHTNSLYTILRRQISFLQLLLIEIGELDLIVLAAHRINRRLDIEPETQSKQQTQRHQGDTLFVRLNNLHTGFAQMDHGQTLLIPFFLGEQQTVQLRAQGVLVIQHIETAFQTDGNGPSLFGDDNGHRIANFTGSDCGPVPCPQIPAQVVVVRKGNMHPRRSDTSATDQHGSVV